MGAVKLALTNRKGGVGKTTHALTVGSGLAAMGFRVGIVDTDSQGHVATSLGTPKKDGLYRVLVRDEDYTLAEPTVNSTPIQDGDYLSEYEEVTYEDSDANVFRVSPGRYSAKGESRGELFVLPGAERTWRIASELGSNVFGFMIGMDEFASAFDLNFVIIDTSPTLKDLDAQVALAVDSYIYVTEPEHLSVGGVNEAIKQIRKIAEMRQSQLRRSTRILGVLPNKVRYTDLHQHYLDELCNRYGDLVMSSVGLRTKWGEASAMGETIFRYASGSSAEKEAWQVVREVIQRIKAWQETE